MSTAGFSNDIPTPDRKIDAQAEESKKRAEPGCAELIGKLDALIAWAAPNGDSGWQPSISLDDYKAIRAALAAERGPAEPLTNLLMSCRTAMQVSQDWPGDQTDWRSMMTAIDAALATPATESAPEPWPDVSDEVKASWRNPHTSTTMSVGATESAEQRLTGEEEIACIVAAHFNCGREASDAAARAIAFRLASLRAALMRETK